MSKEQPSKKKSGVEYYQKVLAKPETPDKPLTGVREFTINHLFAEVWSRPQLSIRDRRLITTALLASQGHQKQLKGHIQGALRGEDPLTKEELLEVMVQVAHYAGWAAGTSGQQAVLEVIDSIHPEQEK